QRGAGSTAVRVGGLTIPADELAFQINAELKQIARDVEKTFITGTYARPVDNTSPRQTRGLLEAITTNVETATNWSDFKADDLLDLMQGVWESGGLQEGETRTIIVNATGKRALTREFINEGPYRETSRNVGGVNLQTIETDFGRCNIMLNRYMPADTLVVASLEDLAPVFLRIPGKGHFFVEPLAKVGAAERVQIYGEIGLKYGHEARHGKLTVGEDSGS